MLGKSIYEECLPEETLTSSSSHVSFGGPDNTGGHHDTTNQIRSDILSSEGTVVLSYTLANTLSSPSNVPDNGVLWPVRDLDLSPTLMAFVTVLL